MGCTRHERMGVNTIDYLGGHDLDLESLDINYHFLLSAIPTVNSVAKIGRHSTADNRPLRV